MDTKFAKYTSEILKAYSEGKIIEKYYEDAIKGIATWEELKELTFSDLYSKLRIKKVPKLRPYANAQEFLEAQKEHGPYLKRIKSGVFRIPIIISNKNIVFSGGDANSYEDLESYIWQDGTPFGIFE